MRYGLLHCDFLRIKNIRIIGATYINSNKLEFKLSRLLDRNIYDVQNNEIEETADEFPGVKSITIFRIIPHTLKIKIRERKQVAYVKKDFDQIFFIDHDGVILEQVKHCRQSLLPIFENLNINNLTPGDAIEDRSLKILFTVYDIILEQEPEFLNNIRSFNINNENVILTERKHDVRFLIGDEDFTNRIERLIFAYNNFGVARFSEIDVRFSDIENELVILR